MRYRRTLWYRDEWDCQCQVRIEANDPQELARIVALYAEIEEESRREEKSWKAQHGRFADLDAPIGPDQFAEAARAKGHQEGFPWEGPRYDFPILLGNGLPWDGPRAQVIQVEAEDGSGEERVRYLESAGPRECPLGHADEPLRPQSVCLLCCRSGMDLVIPRPSVADLKKRAEPKQEKAHATAPPRPRKGRDGRVLAGGLKGKV